MAYPLYSEVNSPEIQRSRSFWVLRRHITRPTATEAPASVRARITSSCCAWCLPPVQRHPETATETRQLLYHFFWDGAKVPTKPSNFGETMLVF
jgi:hypothetical protein